MKPNGRDTKVTCPGCSLRNLRAERGEHITDDDRLTVAFELLLRDERQLLVCALLGSQPPALAHLRLPVMRALEGTQGNVWTAGVHRETYFASKASAAA